MDNLIDKIVKGKELEEIIEYVRKDIYVNGPISTLDMEILSYLKYYQPEFLSKYEGDILERMGIFYKENKINSIEGLIMSNYKKVIAEKYNKFYTPIQTNLINNILLNKNFSFSAPTSTGKSYVFREIIEDKDKKDVAIIVPSRALINEYFIKIRDIIKDKSVNVLTSVEIINKKIAKRNVFILTPERAKELFKYKEELQLDFVLFDEAQLGDEESTRGMIFDSIVRRIKRNFPKTKLLFAHPFINNPEAQLKKNNIEEGDYKNYLEKNVGQMFISYDSGKYYHFGIEKEVMGNNKIKMEEDPIKNIIINNGTVLIYTAKTSIYNGKIFEKFGKYIELCEEIKDKKALKLIKELKELIGATQKKKSEKYSKMIELLKRGIITHHGSLPLKARIILEEFTQNNFCRICFATSTLVQGINMPFDVVWIDKFESSQMLSILNLIGRAGRATTKEKFDYGIVVVKDANKSRLRSIIKTKIKLKEVSLLDVENNEEEDNVRDFKESIKNGTLSDEYNLTQKQLERLEEKSLDNSIEFILEKMVRKNSFISVDEFNKYERSIRTKIREKFEKIYIAYLNRAELSSGEKSVLSNAIKILVWQINGKTFKQVVWYRYSYITRLEERKELMKQKNKKEAQNEIANMEARFTMECSDIPNKDLMSFNMLKGKKVNEVSYDRIVFDTYDYIDKIIGFKLKDIYYATFQKFFERTGDIRAKNMALYLKYGTIDYVEIMLIRYGFSFETIEWLKKYVKKIDEDEIVFKKKIMVLSKDKFKEIEHYV